MFATFVNGLIVIAGGLIGVLFRDKINRTYTDAVFFGLGLVVLVMGVMNAIKTADVLGMVLCLALGILIGEGLDLEGKTEKLGQRLEKKMMRGKEDGGRFSQGFVSGSLLFCVGSMAIMGALEAGIHHDSTIILSKAMIDGIAAITLAAGLGIGVAFSALAIWAYQGTLTFFAGYLAPYLQEAVVLEMSAIGGVLLIAISLNMLGIGKHAKVANMLPAIFLPLLYQPIVSLIGSLF